MTTHSARFIERPHTRTGWWAVWLMAAFVAMFLVNAFVFMAFPSLGDGAWQQTVLPFYGIAMLLCGLLGKWLDQQLGTSPFLMIFLFLAGGGSALYYGILSVLK